MKFIFFIGFLFVFIFFSCGKSYKERAAEKYELAVDLCEKGDSLKALQQLDSIQTFFPEAFKTVETAKALEQKIYSEILFRKQDHFDKLSGLIVELGQNFSKEKTEYDRFLQYIPKMQNFDRRWNSSYLKVHLNENGDLYLSSNFYGAEWLNHVALRVYDGVFQAKTDTVPLDDPNNHHSDFMNTHWEKVSYKNGKDNGVIQFIADNADRNLKAVFLGKRMYFIVLEQSDKQAVKDALALSASLKSKIQLEKEIKLLQQKLN
jgi:hypothetical protein